MGTGAPYPPVTTVVAGASCVRLMRSLTSSRSISNSAMSFSASNSTSSLISFGFICRPGAPREVAARHWIENLFLFCNTSVQFEQLFVHGSQNIVSAFGHHQHIFNANPALARQINSGLYRDDHSGPESCITARCQSRELMNFQSNTVSGGVREEPVQPGALQLLPRRPVDFSGGHSGPYRADCGLLRIQDGQVQPAGLG